MWVAGCISRFYMQSVVARLIWPAWVTYTDVWVVNESCVAIAGDPDLPGIHVLQALESGNANEGSAMWDRNGSEARRQTLR